MIEKDLKAANLINDRIRELDIEIHALFNANGKRINPLKSFVCRGHIMRNHGIEEKEITLTVQDINALMDIRTAEKEHLMKILEEL